MGLQLGAKKIHLEGDSMIVVNGIRQGLTPDWKLNRWIKQIIVSIVGLEDFVVSLIFPDGNTLADELAKNVIPISNILME